MKIAKKNTIIYGRHPVVDAIKDGKSLDKILLQNSVKGLFEKELRLMARQRQIPVQVVPKEKMNRVTGGNHQGIIGFLALVDYQKLDDILPFVFEQSQTPLFLILDGVTDVRNFGAIARSAECMGAHAIVVSSKSAAPINAEAIKTSAGALTRIPVCREPSLKKTIEQLQLSGVSILASDLKADKKIYELDMTAPVAIVLGSEGGGVQGAILEQVDQRFIIPQAGQMDSLNVSVAAGVILYEVVRQRGVAGI